MTEFTERSPIEADFSEVFRSRVAPRLSELEAQRQAILAAAKRYAAMALAGGAALGLLFVIFGTGANGPAGLLIGFGVPMAFGAVAALLLWKRQAVRWSSEAAQIVMPVVCDFLANLNYDREAHKGFPLERMQKMGVIRPFTRSQVSDRLEGTYRDTAFEIVEAKLISDKSQSSANADNDTGDRSSKTLFKGLLLRISVPDPIPTRILIARDFGMGNKLTEMFGGTSGRGMPKVETGHAEFERHFEAYSADPQIARNVLAPEFLDSLVPLAKDEGGRHGAKGLEAGFHDVSFFMALKRDVDFIKIGGLTAPADKIEEDLHGVFDDIATARRIIDRLHGDHPEP
ncbi:Protein of unknown function [Roseovarius nanhaiticus]|uniref:DUF3137 domain-containing protein n=1 Tax=Roseovarius nanhaiticus TaxID=573024 RepID=A0A1N7HNC6_9RHOB|nr:DUF3137 domain-containing protein [Roseovarius nanhaiticus]SEL39726.1 Protein of unknown function [Roseovarius nanhaiticus]SIS26357.1 Protein of unknown function [Roseovarius nanhaiticus]